MFSIYDCELELERIPIVPGASPVFLSMCMCCFMRLACVVQIAGDAGHALLARALARYYDDRLMH